MKKAVSLMLSLALICGSLGCIFASAASVNTKGNAYIPTPYGKDGVTVSDGVTSGSQSDSYTTVTYADKLAKLTAETSNGYTAKLTVNNMDTAYLNGKYGSKTNLVKNAEITTLNYSGKTNSIPVGSITSFNR